MIKSIFFLLALVASPTLFADELFAKMNQFQVHYVIEDSALALPLKLETIRSLEKIGNVFPGVDETLSKKEKDKKYQTGQPILQLFLYRIAEEDTDAAPTYVKLPAFALDLKVIAEVEILNNQQQISAPIWEKLKFVSTQGTKDELIQLTTKTLHALLAEFTSTYQQSNPDKNSKPQFFFL